MSHHVPIKFVVGSRVLLSVPKALQTVSLSLADAVADHDIVWPPLTQAHDGYRVLSATTAKLAKMRAAYPNLILGGLQQYRRHYIDMAGGFDDYMSRFSSKTRSTLRRKYRKLAKELGGNVEFREYRTPNEMNEFRDLALPLSRRTYQAKSLGAGLPESDKAHEQRRTLAKQDNVRAFLLCTEGKPISYLYLPVNGQTINYAFLGYDPEYARLSPGTVLQLEALERLFSEKRFRYFDFTEGEGAHKAMFGTDSVECCSFFLLRRRAANRVLLKSVDAFDASVARAKHLAQRSGALARLRGALRAG